MTACPEQHHMSSACDCPAGSMLCHGYVVVVIRQLHGVLVVALANSAVHAENGAEPLHLLRREPHACRCCILLQVRHLPRACGNGAWSTCDISWHVVMPFRVLLAYTCRDPLHSVVVMWGGMAHRCQSTRKPSPTRRLFLSVSKHWLPSRMPSTGGPESTSSETCLE